MAKWRLTISLFVKDLQFVQSEYNTQKQSPPLNRDLPPIAGKIAWSRQLYHRISQPVKVFQEQQEVLKLPETRKAIRSFNRLAQVWRMTTHLSNVHPFTSDLSILYISF